MIKNYNRWAVVDYLRHIRPEDPIYKEIGDIVDTDIRPELDEDEDALVKRIINIASEYKTHQTICLLLIDDLRNGDIPDSIIVRVVSALMLDTTVRYPDWEKSHAEWSKPNRAKRILLVDGATGEQKIY